MDYHKLLASHWQRGADVTICVIPKSESLAFEFWFAELGVEGRVEQFREKPQRRRVA